MAKVLVIGLDGATLDLVDPWMLDGALPVFAGLRAEGAHGRLRSVPNTDTAPAWTSFATGLNPANHGLFNELGWSADRRTLIPVKGADRWGKSLWRRVSDAGRRVVVVNVPFSYPAEPVDGVMLSGVDCPGTTDPGFAHPPTFLDELRRAGIAYRIDAEVHIPMKEGRPADALESAYAVAEGHTAALLLAMDRRPWDLAVGVYSLPDEAQHYFWRAMTSPAHPFGDAVLEAHRFVERQIAALRAASGDDTVLLVFSDHGFGPLCATTERLADWLIATGFLVRGSKKPGPWRARCADAVYGAARRHLGEGTKASLRRTLPGLRDRVESDRRFAGVDWSATRAFAVTSPWDIWVNTRGREPEGIVEPGAEYEVVCDELLAALAAWRDPVSGRPVVAHAWRREEVYQGRYASLAPDITVAYDPASAPDPETLPGNRSGFDADHQPEGLLFVAGPGVAAGRTIEDARLEDLTPTVLALLGLEVPADLDGRVLSESFA